MKKLLVLFAISYQLIAISFSANAQSLTVSASTISNVSCYGGSNGIVSATASAGNVPYTYVWSPGGQTNLTAVNLTAATYTVHVTDRLGFSASASATVTQPTALSISAWATYTAVCAGQTDSLFVSSSGGTIPMTYSWIGPLDGISAPSSAKTLCYPYGAAYIVTAVSDYNGCTASASVNVIVHTPPFVSIQGPLSPVTTFNNDTLIALSPGASSYLWSNSATTSAIIVSPVVSTTYSVTTTNIYSCYDTAHYTVTPNTSGNGKSSSTAIVVSPSTNLTTTSYSSLDSVVWFSFTPTDSNNQIIANSAYMGLPFPHTHRLTLFDNMLNTVMDEPLPDIVGANQIRLDISHLHPGSTYYVRAARTPAHPNMPGCNPSSAHECNPGMRWDFQMCFRTVPVFVPDDSGNEAPSITQLYYEHRGQISDLNDIPRFDIKAYTNMASPQVYASDSLLSFVYGDADTLQRVDMTLTGAYVQPSQPVYKMQEDSNAGYLNYFKEYIQNGVPKIEGYSRLAYKNVYPNIDMEISSNGDGTKFYFICAPASGGSPGGNPSEIELQFNGANSVSVTGSGGLNVNTNFGTLNFAPGTAYTDSAGIIKPKSWQPYFVAVNSNTVKFNTGSYNTAEPLVIRVDRGHPTSSGYAIQGNMIWNTYYGGTDANDAGAFNGVTHDNSGNVYAVGWTTAQLFPLNINFTGLQKTNKGDTDAVIVKFQGSNDSMLWACYYGGKDADIGRGITAEPSGGSVFITGYTNSPDLPMARNGAKFSQTLLNGTGSGTHTDMFVAGINGNGFDMFWGTYYGGPGNESGHAITLDNANNLYVVGDGDNNTPRDHKPYAYNDSTGSALIVEFFVPTLDTEWATVVGSATSHSGYNSCATDFSGNLFVAGASLNGYPVVGGGSYTFSGGLDDATLTKFGTDGAMIWSTYFGGDARDLANAVGVDGRGNIYMAGHTYSPDDAFAFDEIQTQQKNGWGYFQPDNGSGFWGTNGNGFISEFDESGNLEWGTYFGGKGDLDIASLAIDGNGSVYITGSVFSNDSSMVWPSGGQAAGSYVRTSITRGSLSGAYIAVFNAGGGYYWGTYGASSGIRSAGYGITVYNTWKLYTVGITGTFNYYPLVSPPAGGWLQNTIGSASYSGFISEFNLIGLPTGTQELAIDNGELKVYPNPTNENVTVKMNIQQTGNAIFTLYNLLGEPVYTDMTYEHAGTVNKQIPLASLPNGDYVLQVISGGSVYHTKIAKLQ